MFPCYIRPARIKGSPANKDGLTYADMKEPSFCTSRGSNLITVLEGNAGVLTRSHLSPPRGHGLFTACRAQTDLRRLEEFRKIKRFFDQSNSSCSPRIHILFTRRQPETENLSTFCLQDNRRATRWALFSLCYRDRLSGKRVMPASNASTSGQILLFPYGDVAEAKAANRPSSHAAAAARGTSVVLCGTYRKDPEGLRQTFDRLKDTGFSILSPSNPFIETEDHGFVYMRRESMQTPDKIENKHLDAIQQADFVWFFAPDGYVGPTGALEVGFARAAGVPVYTDTSLNDLTIKNFVEVVDSPSAVYEAFKQHRVLPPSPAIKSFQHYYRRAAMQRGFSRENAKDCLLLMVEEVGELARALRKRMKLTRHGKPVHNQEELELADVFLYVVHMANILKIDLATVVQRKELLNIQKLIHGG